MRSGRKNWNNYSTNKNISKVLILHRIWNNLSQENMAKINHVTFQQYQKVEKCHNRIFAEQLFAICKDRKWDISLFLEDPMEILIEWKNRDFPDFKIFPDKIHRIIKAWEKLDREGEANYYGKDKSLELNNIHL